MLLVSAFLHLGRKNGAKYSTRDGATKEMSEYDAWFCVCDLGNKNVEKRFSNEGGVVLYCIVLCKESEQYISPRIDSAVGLFRDVLLVSVSRLLGRKNGAKCSTRDGVVLSDSKKL